MTDDEVIEWMAHVDGELNYLYNYVPKVENKAKAGFIIGVAAAVPGLLALFMASKIAKGLMPMADLLTKHEMFLRSLPTQQAVEPTVQTKDRANFPSDTGTTPEVAEPALGPESHVSDEVRAAMESDPLNPAQLRFNELDER